MPQPNVISNINANKIIHARDRGTNLPWILPSHSWAAKKIFLPRNSAIKNLLTGKERKSKGSSSEISAEKHCNVCTNVC